MYLFWQLFIIKENINNNVIYIVFENHFQHTLTSYMQRYIQNPYLSLAVGGFVFTFKYLGSI